MSGRLILLTAASWILSAVAMAQDSAGREGALSLQQRAQQRARAAATDLVSGVLDIQIRQLEENRLEKLPVYGELVAMRGHLDQLIEQNMQDVMVLLAEVERADASARERLFEAARAKVRAIVVALMSERQKLHKRMQLARVAAQTRQLVDIQSQLENRTRGLSDELPSQREQLAVHVLEDQRDLTAMYFQLREALHDVSSWEGPIGAGASQGLRLLKSLQVDRETQLAEQRLRASEFPPATESQRSIIKSLQALLDVLERSQGLESSSRSALARRVAELIKEQEQLRTETKPADLTDPDRSDQLANRQRNLHQQIGSVADSLRSIPSTQALVEQAQAAAYEAETKIFEGDSAVATQQQGRVVGSLAEIEKRLRQSEAMSSDKTAEQLAREIEQLEKLDQALSQVQPLQQEAVEQAAVNAALAKEKQVESFEQLSALQTLGEFGAAIDTRVLDAQDAAQRASEEMQPAGSEDRRREAARGALQATNQAITEVKQTLADTRRRQLAVLIGEIARAAEALERASAAERGISLAAREAAQGEGLDAERANWLSAEHDRVNMVAQDVAQGIRNFMPPAAEQLDQLEPLLAAVAESLGPPGPGTKPAVQAASTAASRASQQLATAAATLRQEVSGVAAGLVELVQQQMPPLVETRKSVESALADLSSKPESLEQRASLSAAWQQTRQAEVEQLRAAGLPAAASAETLRVALEELSSLEAVSERSAQDLVRGKTSSPSAASAAAQQLAETAAQLAGSAPAAIVEQLRLATAAAQDAAREIVIGNPSQAAAARQLAREAVRRARQAAETSAAEARKERPGALDAAAQGRVSRLVEAAQQASAAAPQAATQLAGARSHSASAEKALAEQQPANAAGAQAQTMTAIEAAREQLQHALEALRDGQARDAQQLAELSSTLAQQAEPLDAGATVALQQAQAAARQAAIDPAAVEKGVRPEVQAGWERATASLAAREQLLLRDQRIAEAIAALAQQQQEARNQIAQQAAKLEQLADKPSATPDGKQDPASPAQPPTEEQLAAAQALAQAADQFAEAQRATGEGAAEISGQQQVANPSLREGLETASQLSRPAEEAAADAKPAEQGELGTDFVPNSPEVTANQIAGKKALEAAAEAMAQQQAAQSAQPSESPSGQQPETSDKSVAQSAAQQQPSDTTAANIRQGGASSEADTSQVNESMKRVADDAQRNDPHDSRSEKKESSTEIAQRRFADDPWFARLPPALQKAIQARSRQTAPRGYEERLKRYFESIDE